MNQQFYSQSLDVKQDVYYAEIDIKHLLKAISTTHKVKAISKFPSSRRDLALVIDEQINFDQIETIARKTDKKILKEIGLFDVYKDKKRLGEGKKSYAVSFIFENLEKTLNDKEIEKVMGKMQKQFESELGAVVRN